MCVGHERCSCHLDLCQDTPLEEIRNRKTCPACVEGKLREDDISIYCNNQKCGWSRSTEE